MGGFKSRDQLLKVPGFGPKIYQQAAGFLRCIESENALDRSAVHPERYELVENIAQSLGARVNELVGNSPRIKEIPIEQFVSAHVGLPTLRDIMAELEKPGRDPRDIARIVTYDDQVTEMEHLRDGMILEGCVTNVTNFELC